MRTQGNIGASSREEMKEFVFMFQEKATLVFSLREGDDNETSEKIGKKINVC